MADYEVNRVISNSDTVVNVEKSERETCGVEETNTDLLKNTPSNIARLEDVIEQCKGRQKYLAQTRSPSDGSDVRWYFCKVPLAENEPAASVPPTEIVGKSDYFRFSMRDSLAIEASFLQMEEELLSSWWKEYAECSEGPKERPSSSSTLQSKTSLQSASSSQQHVVEEERVGVPVKGGLYEVDLVKRHCFPVYWSGENRRVLRGHWFAHRVVQWFPLREDVAEQLEFAYRGQVWHRRTFQPSGLFAARVDLQGSTPGLHVLFTGEDDTWEAWLNVDASGFSSFISLGGKGIKLRRGYSASQSVKPTPDDLRQQKEEEMDDYCSQVPVRHLVFMVHGIGQRLEKSNLIDDVTNFRHMTANLAEQHLTAYQRGNQRVLFIPCQWRRGLKLSGEAAVEKITLDGVRGLRIMLSATVHDVLYYMSPIYCQDIVNSVSNQLNRLYLKFLKRNPSYDGKVSIYGHSLGSVLSYDILCHQENSCSPFPMDLIYKKHSGHNEIPLENNRSSICDPMTSFEKVESTVNNLAGGMHDFIGEEKIGSQPPESVLEEEHGVDSPAIVDSVTLDGNETLARTANMFHQEKDGLDETTSINCGAPAGGSEKMMEETSADADDKDKIIKLLKEEIESLKSRITKLELQSSKRDKETEWDLNMAMPKHIPQGKDDTPKSYTPYIKYTKLEFEVDTFFAVGSPLGVFLALRNIRIGIGKGQEYWEEENISEEMPACRRMINIFHPFDPVAYRIEPLICKDYISKRPVIIPYHKGGKRLHIGFQEFTETWAAKSQAIMNNLCYVRVKVLTACQSRNRDDEDEAPKSFQEKEERSYGSTMMERLTGSEDGRVDHVLQDKTFEHAYISAIGAHTNYWRDYDTALFILKHLYRDIPEDPNSPGKYNEDALKRGAADEELPLTFSDAVLVRNCT